ncbi:MAG TPA: efflux RND transporter periplasmic adaptor subunit, partial [Steroidobacteraceae bacterium]|nr:efflux RND transporter periplasmic adaptor subunit [Steroidobacteraceae bacterium]
MKKRILLAGLVALAAAGLAWWLTHRQPASNQIVLYGNVDLREVDLAFNGSQRIARVLVQEGERVRKGQVLARLDTSRLQPQLARAEAQAAAQRAAVERLRHGSRPEEIAQARANLMLAQADARLAGADYRRIDALFSSSSGRAVSRQSVDGARARADVAHARVLVSRQALQLALLGPRKEDIAQAQAMLAGEQAQVALLQQELADAQLRAPLDAVVRSRLAEPGDMASPQKTAFTLAITDPKWVRAYVSEPDLGWVRPGMPATVAVDSFPARRFPGWVGFISPVAEFTPKTVQTQELRSSLVYEIRVFVQDPGDVLRLRMPATV